MYTASLPQALQNHNHVVSRLDIRRLAYTRGRNLPRSALSRQVNPHQPSHRKEQPGLSNPGRITYPGPWKRTRVISGHLGRVKCCRGISKR